MRKVAITSAVVVPFGLAGLLLVGAVAVASGEPQLARSTVPKPYRELIERYGRTCDELTPPRLAAQIYAESRFNPRAVSPDGAQGIAQFMPSTWQVHGVDGNGDGRRDPYDPEDAIPAAATYDCRLASYVGGVPGDRVSLMLAAYNAGPYAVIRYDGIPPFTETRGYIDRIRRLEKAFTSFEKVDSSAAAAQAILYAQSKLGTPYLWGGEGTPEQGGRFDCSGLMQAAYKSAGINLPRTSREQWYAGPHVPRDQLQPGDLVFFAYDLDDPGSIHHVGLYVGSGTMIDAPYTGAVIRFDPIDQPDYIGAVRPTA